MSTTFVLDTFNSSVTMGTAGNLYSSAIPALDVSATAILYVDVSAMQSVFKFSTDSMDFSNMDNSDIRYTVDTTSWPVLNPANAMMGVTGLSTGAVTTTDRMGPIPPSKLFVAHDFTRYLATKLFGTHFGVDLFNNELQLIQNIRSICDGSAVSHTWYDVVSKITAVSKNGTHAGLVGPPGDKFMTNATNDSTNLCRVLLSQMIGAHPERFQNLVASDLPQSLPFQVDDAISFKLTIAPAAGQESLTGVAVIGARSYEIRLVLKAGAQVNNYPVSMDEL